MFIKVIKVITKNNQLKLKTLASGEQKMKGEMLLFFVTNLIVLFHFLIM